MWEHLRSISSHWLVTTLRENRDFCECKVPHELQLRIQNARAQYGVHHECSIRGYSSCSKAKIVGEFSIRSSAVEPQTMNPRGQVAPQAQLRRVPATPPFLFVSGTGGAAGAIWGECQRPRRARSPGSDRWLSRIWRKSPKSVHFDAELFLDPLFSTCFFLKLPL